MDVDEPEDAPEKPSLDDSPCVLSSNNSPYSSLSGISSISVANNKVNPELLAKRLKEMRQSRRRSSLFNCPANKVDDNLSQLFPEEGTAKDDSSFMLKSPDFSQSRISDVIEPLAASTPKRTFFLNDSLEKYWKEHQKHLRFAKQASTFVYKPADLEVSAPSFFAGMNREQPCEPTEARDFESFPEYWPEEDSTKLCSFSDTVENALDALHLPDSNKSLLNSTGILEGNSSRFVFSSYGCCEHSLSCAQSSLMASLTESVNYMKNMAKHLKDFPGIFSLCEKLEPAFLIYEMSPILPLIANLCEIELMDIFLGASKKEEVDRKTNQILLCLAKKSKQTTNYALELSKEMEADLPKSKFIDKLTDAMCADQDTNPEKKTEYLKNMNDIRKQSELVKKCLDLRRVEFKQEIDRRKNELEAKMDKNTKDFEAFIAKVMENLKEIANGDD
uniref:Uncharacterized protein n=1 Tax=Panagrolaimus sp. JU765 TaxID=591449 RepID=A0AC34QK50_9BILA